MSNLLLLLLIIPLFFVFIEIRHRLKPSSPLKLRLSDWEVKNSRGQIDVKGFLEIVNPHPRMEVMIPELTINPILLGNKQTQKIKIISKVIPIHPDQKSRKDGYWSAYILKGLKKTKIELNVVLDHDGSDELKSSVETLWIDIHWLNYGPFGRLKRLQGISVPIQKPASIKPSKAYFLRRESFQVLPLKTHILGVLDDPIQVIDDYTKDVSQPGDIITIGETPLAIMQGRYRHPSTIDPSWVARTLCRGFHPTSSFATACGLQSLIDIIGPTRVIISWAFGAVFKLIGINGVFYQLASEQARLIDDITGTTPPYDQTVVLGPRNSYEFCKAASEKLGLQVAVVDVNDLGRVKILSSSRGCDKSLLKKALIKNPAGNADEQTPLVLVRQC